jgi:two-component system, cell cycle response regulator DivK
MSVKLSKGSMKEWRVVVVDDDPHSAEIVGMLLSHYGAAVFSAANGKEGLAVIERVNPHLVISDLSMPEMDGWAMIRALKARPETATIPLIALSAHAMASDREKAIAAGFHSYIAKPLSASTFVADLLQMVADIPELKLSV